MQITAPELDHQISQAQGTLVQYEASLQRAQANKELAEVTWKRDDPLVGKGWVTAQQGDIDRLTLKAREAAVGIAQGNAAAQQALVRTLQQRRRPIRASLPRLTVSSLSAMSTWAPWSKPMRRVERSCSPS